MTGHTTVRAGVLVAAAAAVLPLLAAAAKENAGKLEVYKGKVVPLSELVEKSGSKLDADAAPHWLGLVTAEGKVHPLVKDGGSRMFFKDKALLNRDVRLTGRLVPGSGLIRVASVRSVGKKGELYEVYYWCDVCSIRRSEKMICECCGGKMDLREDPVK